MRLLNTQTMVLEEYLNEQIPQYAILSHCWGLEEVTFQDINSSDWHQLRGASKIVNSAALCQKSNLSYIWIDTCCIDKKSSAELSEAINSMYRWYASSAVCYAYLEDVQVVSEERLTEDIFIEAVIKSSRWFTRGWTLQELIAPKSVKFFTGEWTPLGDKNDLAGLLSVITTIPEDVLKDPSKKDFSSVARKMTWAAGRQTTRTEDIAYCLLGLFDVNMPLLYGEGKKAFIRLQEEILKETDDQSLFAWGFIEDRDLKCDDCLNNFKLGILAPSPGAFVGSQNIVPGPEHSGQQPYVMTNKGLRIELPFRGNIDSDYMAMLNCHPIDDHLHYIGIFLQQTPSPSVFVRYKINDRGKSFWSRRIVASLSTTYFSPTCTTYIAKQLPKPSYEGGEKISLNFQQPSKSNFKVIQISPKPMSWTQEIEDHTSSLETGITMEPLFKPQDSANIVLYDYEENLAFVLNFTPETHAGPSIVIIFKRASEELEDWLEEWKKPCVLKRRRNDRHQWVYISRSGVEKRIEIRAQVDEKEGFDQKIFVLKLKARVGNSRELFPFYTFW